MGLLQIPQTVLKKATLPNRVASQRSTTKEWCSARGTPPVIFRAHWGRGCKEQRVIINLFAYASCASSDLVEPMSRTVVFQGHDSCPSLHGSRRGDEKSVERLRVAGEMSSWDSNLASPT